MLEAKKSLGQNFLKDTSALRAMVDAGDVKTGDVVLEIGPGEGVLTRELLSRGACVISVEKDHRLISILKNTFKKEIESGKLKIIEGDILKLPIKDVLGVNSGYKLIANIPYYITGAIIRLFLERDTKPSVMVLMVQKEVAERIVANDGKESILSLSVKVYGVPKKIKTVPRGAFVPMPNVDSAILKIDDIHLRLKNQNEESMYFKLVKNGFSSKRKKLSSNLKNVVDSPTKNMEEVGIEPNSRAEDISFLKWCELTKRIIGN